jgi:hypothetical protein
MAHRYESTTTRLEQITEAGYKVQVMWECEFDTSILVHHHELQVQPIVEHSPLNTRDALYEVRTEATWLLYKIHEGEIIQYVDVMILYPYICKYYKFPIGHPKIHVGDTC